MELFYIYKDLFWFHFSLGVFVLLFFELPSYSLLTGLAQNTGRFLLPLKERGKGFSFSLQLSFMLAAGVLVHVQSEWFH